MLFHTLHKIKFMIQQKCRHPPPSSWLYDSGHLQAQINSGQNLALNGFAILGGGGVNAFAS